MINEEVDDYFDITLQFENGIMAQLELGTYYLTDKPGWHLKDRRHRDGYQPKISD